MMNRVRTPAFAAAVAMVFVTLATATATATDKRIPTGTLSPDEIVSKLEAAGYSNIQDVEYDDSGYEAEATTASGVAVDLDIDPLTGKVTREEAE